VALARGTGPLLDMITSADNPKVKQARALLSRRGREQSAQCLAEGVRLIEDVMGAGQKPALIFCVQSAQALPRAHSLLSTAEAAGIPVWELSEAVFATLSDTVSSQGVLAVVPIPRFAPPLATSLRLVLDQVRDPGNLGTILRSAEAAGVGQVLLARGSTDPWSPKVLRAAMGAHFRLPVLADLDWPAVAALVQGCAVWAADVRGDLAYDQVDWTQPSVVVVGGETEGISRQALELARGRVVIPMRSGAESLNAAMAATVLLFEAARQRRHAGASD
jgi:RNA methyltransferase, TrmH family